MSNDTRWADLMRTFPSLARKDAPTTPAALDKWALGRGLGHGALSAVTFLLYVWDPRGSWTCTAQFGVFNLHQAWSHWDDEHRAAWQRWAADVWFA